MLSILPPGVTDSMIEEQCAERPCEVCGLDPKLAPQTPTPPQPSLPDVGDKPQGLPAGSVETTKVGGGGEYHPEATVVLKGGVFHQVDHFAKSADLGFGGAVVTLLRDALALRRLVRMFAQEGKELRQPPAKPREDSGNGEG